MGAVKVLLSGELDTERGGIPLSAVCFPNKPKKPRRCPACDASSSAFQASKDCELAKLYERSRRKGFSRNDKFSVGRNLAILDVIDVVSSSSGKGRRTGSLEVIGIGCRFGWFTEDCPVLCAKLRAEAASGVAVVAVICDRYDTNGPPSGGGGNGGFCEDASPGDDLIPVAILRPLLLLC